MCVHWNSTGKEGHTYSAIFLFFPQHARRGVDCHLRLVWCCAWSHSWHWRSWSMPLVSFRCSAATMAMRQNARASFKKVAILAWALEVHGGEGLKQEDGRVEGHI